MFGTDASSKEYKEFNQLKQNCTLKRYIKSVEDRLWPEMSIKIKNQTVRKDWTNLRY